MKFADPLYDIVGNMQMVMGRRREKDPPLMQATADTLRTIWGEDCFARHARMRAEQHLWTGSNIVFSDFRHLIEYKYFHDFVTVCIRRPIETTDRNSQHSSENELDNFDYDYIIDNDGTLDELYAKIDDVIFSIRSTTP